VAPRHSRKNQGAFLRLRRKNRAFRSNLLLRKSISAQSLAQGDYSEISAQFVWFILKFIAAIYRNTA
jgi:hypothetical protein